MLVLSVLRQNRFRRVDSSHDGAIIVQRMKSSAPLNALSDSPPTSSKLPHSLTPKKAISSLKRADSLWKVGAKASIVGGVENAVTNAVNIKAKSFALFLKSPFEWTSPSLTPHSISKFKKRMKHYGYSNKMVLPISNYHIYLDNPESCYREKSRKCFMDDLQRCEALDLELYNLCLGFRVGTEIAPIESYLTSIADCINWAHEATRTVTIVLKSIDGFRNSIGSRFSDFARIIAKVNDKTRVGVSLDTFSAFTAGYDIKTKKGWECVLYFTDDLQLTRWFLISQMMGEFDKEIGFNYFRGMHLSDIIPKHDSFQKVQRQNIGLGDLGITAFQHILQDPRTQNIPLILATPGFKQPKAIWGKEIEVLQALTSTSPAIQSEDLQSLVHELKSAIEEAK